MFQSMLGVSEAMRKVFDQIRRAGRAHTTVLLRGESGTGKELAARAIHAISRRKDGPFVALNVAAVPETLIESELFGHVAGAFTGAEKGRVGRFEAAHEGTLFIDEIGDLRLSSQAKLLRVLENRLISPVGSNETRQVDVRVIFATNRNVEKMMAEGRFREDLYYRINVIEIHLPPLRQRKEDIPVLVEYMLDEICAAVGGPRVRLDDALLRFLVTYPWPGNVRQLRSCLESMVILADSPVLTLEHLPVSVQTPVGEGNGCCETCREGTLDDVLKGILLARLRRYAGNQRRAARSLGISARTVQRHLKTWKAGRQPHEIARGP
jgi:transcriptional regulator with PAS, ATPase and Fis domain